MKIYRIAYIASHPIPYISPFLQKLAAHPQIKLTVLYCSNESLKQMYDVDFGQSIKWDIPLLQGYHCKFLKNHSPIGTIYKPPLGLVNFGVIKEVISGDYDCIVVYGWHYFTYWLAYLAAFLIPKPIFIRADPPLIHEHLKPKWKLLCKKIILMPLFKKAAGFLAVGTENSKFYQYYGANKKRIFFVPHAIDNQKWLDRSFEEIKEIPKEKVVILFSGKLIDKKRPFDLLQAYEKISNKNKALVFLGDGKLKASLAAYVKEKKLANVIFAGFQNQTLLPKYYKAANIFVLPSSLGETWGLVVNEAMCFGLPIVVSHLVGSGKDLVQPHKNGYIFQMGNIEELASYLQKLIEDAALRRKMGKQSLKIALGWNYEKGVEGVLKALGSIQHVL